ncbi:hypothetical protein AB0N17_44760 [Streptomyces sp. NPDC051133]|uniref:hypothetical protein n=1 Tax=Streptomyces sp. NPDC051133 TaxID=3155521 RepID=UPI00344A1588
MTLTFHPKPCQWPGERYCICDPGDATGKTVGAPVEYAVIPSYRGRIAATVPLRGGRPGEVLYEVEWDGLRPPHSRYNRFTSIELRLTSEEP